MITTVTAIVLSMELCRELRHAVGFSEADGKISRLHLEALCLIHRPGPQFNAKNAKSAEDREVAFCGQAAELCGPLWISANSA